MQRSPPKAELKADPLQHYLIGLARKLGMTYRRLQLEMGQGEVAYQLAYDELEADAHKRRNKQAEQAAGALRRHRR